MAPLVSVVVPTFNRIAWLPDALRSVQTQTMGDLEILLVDDGSTDGTAEWAERLGEPRLRYLRRRRTGSIAATRNAGMDVAGGTWIAFLDSDDRWRPEKLARQLARLADARGAAWCYTKYQMIDAGGDTVPQPHGAAWQAFEGDFLDRILTTDAAVVMPTVVVEAALACALRFDERLPLAEDYDFVLRLAARRCGCVVDEAMVDVRMHAARTTSQAGPFDGYFGKIIAYRKAARTLTDPALRRIARRQQHAHLGVFLRLAVRHGAVGQIARVVAALGRV